MQHTGLAREACHSWCPKGFEFLSGLPEPKRRQSPLMIMQAFVDDSGGKGHSNIFILASVLSSAERWAKFSDEWAECLNGPIKLPYLKMTDAASCKGTFHKVSNDDRDRTLARFAEVVNRHVDKFIHFSVDIDGFEKTIGKRLPKPMNEIYFWCYQMMMVSVGLDLVESGHKERFEIIFDEQVIFGPRARQWHPVLIELLKIKHPALAALFPVDPMFKSDSDFLPLQASDMYAWCKRDALERSESNFQWLWDLMPNVKASRFSADMNMADLVEGLSTQNPEDKAESDELYDLMPEWTDEATKDMFRKYVKPARKIKNN